MTPRDAITALAPTLDQAALARLPVASTLTRRSRGRSRATSSQEEASVSHGAHSDLAARRRRRKMQTGSAMSSSAACLRRCSGTYASSFSGSIFGYGY